MDQWIYWINGSSRNVFLWVGAGSVCACTGAGCAAPAGAAGLVNVLPWAAGGGVGMDESGGGLSGPLRPQPASGSENASAKASARATLS